jgi:hypothetical protein
MKILISGGSIASGYKADQSYAEIIHDSLISYNVELINASAPLENSFHAVRSFEEKVVPVKPDIILLHHGIDDAYHPVYRSEFKENLVQFIRLAQKSFSTEIVLTTSHPFKDEFMMNEVNIYYKTVREVAHDLNCGYIPLHILWYSLLEEMQIKHEDCFDIDERYPNNKGHFLYAKAIQPVLLKMIEVIKCQ